MGCGKPTTIAELFAMANSIEELIALAAKYGIYLPPGMIQGLNDVGDGGVSNSIGGWTMGVSGTDGYDSGWTMGVSGTDGYDSDWTMDTSDDANDVNVTPDDDKAGTEHSGFNPDSMEAQATSVYSSDEYYTTVNTEINTHTEVNISNFETQVTIDNPPPGGTVDPALALGVFAAGAAKTLKDVAGALVDMYNKIKERD
ncbi:MAG: hypothetical protein LBJ67_04985 [Planctomycetaceae bacterium]|nr:hypothetical protein [Planctomycetaceae bacterium]